MNTIAKMTYVQTRGLTGCRAEARLAVSHGGDQGVAPSRQPLSDRRMARARVLAARPARRRQVLPAAAATHWARPSCMAPCSVSTIRVKRRDGTFFLHVQLKCTRPSLHTNWHAGCRSRQTACGRSIQIHALRSHGGQPAPCPLPESPASLQRKGTKEARRLLQRLSGREKRHMRAINHRISKQLIDTAQTTQRQIALEDLTGIRQRTRVRKPQRYCHHSWSFYQLRQFVATRRRPLVCLSCLLIRPTRRRPVIGVASVDIALVSSLSVHAATWSWMRIGMPP